ncbi:hypothetical protein [Thiobacillus sp.]
MRSSLNLFLFNTMISVDRTEATLPELHRRLVANLEPVEPFFDIIVIKDYADDDSWQIIGKRAQSDSEV